MARMAHKDPIHLGLDVHRDTISVATLLPDRTAAAVEQIANDEAAVLAFVGRFADPGRLRVCYEAGPTGYELARLLHSRGVACQGYGLRRADLRSRPTNIRVAVRRSTPLRRGPGQPCPGRLRRAPWIRPTFGHSGATHRRLPLDGAVPYQEVKRRTNVVGLFPDDAAVLRLAGAVLVEAHDEMAGGRAAPGLDSMARLATTGDDDQRPKEVKRASTELVATSDQPGH